MSQPLDFKPICRNLYNGHYYVYLGDDRWRNTSTGVEGTVDPDKASQVFKINLEVTQLVNEYPEIELFIKVLGLRIEKNLEDNSACELAKNTTNQK